MSDEPRRLRHGRVSVALHARRAGSGTPLLLLHAWRGSSADWREPSPPWPGPVFALDFAGHGASEALHGAAYTPELFAADADHALAELGRAAVAGAGLGAYVALLLAGARPDAVRAALLLPGAGLSGAGALPDFERQLPEPGLLPDAPAHAGDPWLPAEATDVRPVDYARSYADAARRLLLAEDGGSRPPWWQAVRGAAASESVAADLSEAFARLARV